MKEFRLNDDTLFIVPTGEKNISVVRDENTLTYKQGLGIVTPMYGLYKRPDNMSDEEWSAICSEEVEDND